MGCPILEIYTGPISLMKATQQKNTNSQITNSPQRRKPWSNCTNKSGKKGIAGMSNTKQPKDVRTPRTQNINNPELRLPKIPTEIVERN